MKIVAYKGRGKHPWRWRLVARNGKIMADSAEGYALKANLKRAIAVVAGVGVPVIWK